MEKYFFIIYVRIWEKVIGMYIICIILGILSGIIFCFCTYGNIKRKECQEAKCLADKHLEMFLLLNRWVQNKQNGKRIGDYLKNHNFERVVIYGLSYIGRLLYTELDNEKIEIEYLVDQNTDADLGEKKVRKLEEKMDSADVVIVTSIYYFEEIEERLRECFDCPVISLADIIYKM